jgi:uncharacterized protein
MKRADSTLPAANGFRRRLVFRDAARSAVGAPFAMAALLAGCASPSPPPVLLHLPLLMPGFGGTGVVVSATGTATAPAPAISYLLKLPVRMPEYLDRTELLVPQGTTLVPVPGYRWAEPLSEAVPRLLRADLAALLGPGLVWSAPLPPGVMPERQWRVEIGAFETDAARNLVRLQANWSLADARGAKSARTASANVEALASDGSAPALAAAHRVALRRLAERIAVTADHLD